MQSENKRKKILFLIFSVFMIFAFFGWLYLRSVRQNQGVLTESDLKVASESESGHDIYVHVTGEVQSPGVVCLKSGARVIDAVNAAGGFTEGADSDSLNLAAIVKDEAKLQVYAKANGGATIEATAAAAEDKRININRATADELETLPGIGETIAAAIIAYRNENGNFQNPEELKNVDRIGDKVFEKIEALICV